MKRAIRLAQKGWGRTNPNPLVGAVLVKGGKVISEGFHRALGEEHAEIDALKNLKQDAAGSTLYVNLEPCSHYGRTPPCSEAIIDSGIKRVVIGMVDPNPKVSGQGIGRIKSAGIEVKVGVLEKEAQVLNEIFINYITQKTPFVIMKSATTIDGKIATYLGDSKWVTGKEARNYVHVIRDRVAAIMVGSKTVLKDNPYLTTRRADRDGRDPIRIIVDSKGILPLGSNVIGPKPDGRVILATTVGIQKDKEEILTQRGVKIIKTGGDDGYVDLNGLMARLHNLGIDSILLEGGGILNGSAIEAGIVNKVMYFIAPKIAGGKDAPTSVEGSGVDKMIEAIKLRDISTRLFGEDILIEGYIS
ncbi:MAG: bifunctional diaminohydroxyphosphoribosylaminopyrimidine deaminase/5-amino-6-(5-phosphoribosylamino)uracil reductase RibD [Clostridium sp.]|nr:bifunctional diaminohydroxyphosphoribosylaminopyrimidine deaminase/5-amino-6-(5-phosphoribosylamino)uracil reductase RibD [Clostridium sp.]